jgi:hypothetical protein
MYVQFCAPGDGRRNRLKHAEQFIEINRSRKRCILLAALQKYTCDKRTYERQIQIGGSTLQYNDSNVKQFSIVLLM